MFFASCRIKTKKRIHRDGTTLECDHNEQREIGTCAINDTIEATRDSLRDMGMEDGKLMESIVM